MLQKVKGAHQEWTPEEIEILQKMRSEGSRYRDIGSALGRTKNSIVGKVAELRRASLKYEMVGKVVEARSNYSGFTHPVYRQRRAKPYTIKAGDATRLIGRDGEGAELVDLTASECKWPVGDLRGDGLKFCAADKGENKNYCDVHHRVAFRRS